MKRTKITIIGGGNMGEALLARLKKNHTVCVCEKDQKRRNFLKRKYKVETVSIEQGVESSKFIVLAVKPQGMEAVLKQVRAVVDGRKVIISIAAGITTSFIEKRIGSKTRVIRTMPNMPAQIGEGITAVSKGRHAKVNDVRRACLLMGAIGRTVVVKENLIDAITAVSGSGPAYVFLFMECLMNASKSLGLDQKLSKQLVMATLKGSLSLVDQGECDPAVLRAKVTSKGGTTQAALEVLKKKKFEQALAQALKAAKKRAKELSKN